MSNLSDYTRGLDDAVWTDALAAKLDTAPSTTTFTDTRAGYLDLLAGGVGSKPVQTYAYKGTFGGFPTAVNITVSITDYLNCLSYSHGDVRDQIEATARSFKATSNTNVLMDSPQGGSGFKPGLYAFAVTRFG